MTWFTNAFLGLITLLGLAAFRWFPVTKMATPRPNIIIIFSDDHALQAISAYGSPYIRTPNIDRIGREGAVFQNMFCTNSICAPSRATLLTGKYSHSNGHRDNYTTFDASQPMFPKYLQQAGYQTAWIGKWHLKANPQYFDFWEVLPGQGLYYNPNIIQMDGKTVRKEGYVTNLITNDALNWLQNNRDTSKPFCLVIGHKAPHREWQPDTTDLHAFDGQTFPLPATFYDTYEGRKAAQHQDMQITTTMRLGLDLKVDIDTMPIIKRMNPAQLRAWKAYYDPLNQDFKSRNLTGKALDNWKYQRYMHDYLACVLSVDRNVGRVLDYLDKQGMRDNTLIMYSSDQGFYLGEHGWFDKRFMYEESMHMPLLVRYPPRLKAGTVTNQLFVNTDFAPTILQMAGLPIPADMQGKSFLPLPKPSEARKAVYYHYYEYPADHRVLPHFGVRTDRYKLIYFYGNGEFWEFFDLKTDPNELKNDYANPKNQAIISQLKKELKKQTLAYKDTEADDMLAKEGL
ncbi:sulfatase family protein [Spirosoma endbachense]|uniref:Sulfatase-like hydrolase/transferase n=1 Tax=Spirosoma endbachense TaxID=2666025 RepID=A0A6P1VTR6_9BACT|nr:sulfatase [Spirosoma endbachense]QHV96004.1 sulfatase-like hydrolase/transferase [Spirosoma endbachense]